MPLNNSEIPDRWVKYGMMLCMVAGLLFIPLHYASASDTHSDSDRKILIGITQNYFNAVTAKDAASLRNYLLPQAQFIYRNGEDADSKLGTTSAAEIFARLPKMSGQMVERMQDPKVLVQGDIGIVWTRYVFYMNKKFSHCGTDVFTFLKTKDGWKMAGGSWSVEKTTCKPAPMGAPLK